MIYLRIGPCKVSTVQMKYPLNALKIGPSFSKTKQLLADYPLGRLFMKSYTYSFKLSYKSFYY